VGGVKPTGASAERKKSKPGREKSEAHLSSAGRGVQFTGAVTEDQEAVERSALHEERKKRRQKASLRRPSNAQKKPHDCAVSQGGRGRKDCEGCADGAYKKDVGSRDAVEKGGGKLRPTVNPSTTNEKGQRKGPLNEGGKEPITFQTKKKSGGEKKTEREKRDGTWLRE